jgi:peptidoglycan/LPS O-acetylase OafA/YrhL
MKAGTTMASFYRRRFMRILPPFICFLVLYALLPATWGAFTWDEAIVQLKMVPFNFPLWGGHLWFMYPLISIYLIIPVVSPWLEKSSAKDERIFLGIFAFSTLIPWLHRFVSPELWGECFWNQYSALWYCSGYLGYLVLAHYIRVHLKWSKQKKLTVGAISFVIGGLFTAWSFWWKAVPGLQMETPIMEWSWEFCTPNVLLATFGSFLLFSCIQKAPRWINSLAKLTFGMYLMHIFFLIFIAEWLIGGDVAHPLLPVWLAIPAIGLLTFLCCAVTTKIISLIPGSKYIIG